MSYDIYLKDPVSNEILDLPCSHLMTGGIYRADYDATTNTFSPQATQEAWLNITYNYANYYYEATENDERFLTDFHNEKDENGNIVLENGGIRGIYGKTGAESIPMLKDIIERISVKYGRDKDWITTPREFIRYYDEQGKVIPYNEYFNRVVMGNEKVYGQETYIEDVWEGSNDDYWQDTAANALRPLYQLITMAELRPDGVWDGD